MTDGDVPGEPDPKSDFEAWIEALSRAQSMGRDGTIRLSAEDHESLTAPGGLDFDDITRETLHRKMGEVIHASSFAESRIAPLLTYLLNPQAQERVTIAVARLSASQKVEMLGWSLDPDWKQGKLLIAHLKTMFTERNKLAHGVWDAYRILPDHSVERGTWLTVNVLRKGAYVEERHKYEHETFSLLRRRAVILSMALNDYLAFAVSRHLANEPVPSNVSLPGLSLGRWKAQGDDVLADADSALWREYGNLFYQ